MSSFKSPQVIISGKIVKVADTSSNQQCQFYVKVQICQGQDWKLISGKNKFESFASQLMNGVSAIQQPYNLQYVCMNVRGWPRMLLQVWKIDEYGRHNINGYGTVALPMSSGTYMLDVPCWRPTGTWYDRFIGANSELQYPDIVASSLSKYGLRSFSGCIVTVQANIIGRNFHLQGVMR